MQLAGSGVAFDLEGRIAHFHRLHPQPVTRQAAIKRLREFLEGLGVVAP